MSEKVINHQENFKIQGEHYPWGLYVGELRHPARGFLMPAIIENSTASLLIKYNQSTKEKLTHIIDDITSNFVLSVVDDQFPIINILDDTYNNNFPYLQKVNFEQNLRLMLNQKAFDEFNKWVETELIRRNFEVLDENIKSIQEFNAYNKQNDSLAQEEYVLNIINFNDYAKNISRLQTLEKILESSFRTGMKFVFFVDEKKLKDLIDFEEDEKRAKALQLIVNKLLNNMPSISINNNDLVFETKSDLFNSLNEFIKNNKFTSEISSRNNKVNVLENTLGNIYKVYKKKLEGMPKPFLYAEVGVTPNGKERRYFELGERNQAYHAFMIGMNGTGKTTLLDHLIKGIVENTSPKDVELHIFDYKEGVEFIKYKNLPHIKTLMLDNTKTDEIQKSIESFQNLLTERGQLFRDKEVKDINSYNQLDDCENIPRVYLIIDEVQKIFESRESRNITALLIDVAKRGRAFGLTMIFSTQAIVGSNIEPSLLAEFKMRVSFTVNSHNANKIFGVGNEVPVGLRPFNFVMNDGMGIKAANQITMLYRPDTEWVAKVSSTDFGFKHDIQIIDGIQKITELELVPRDDLDNANDSNCSEMNYENSTSHSNEDEQPYRKGTRSSYAKTDEEMEAVNKSLYTERTSTFEERLKKHRENRNSDDSDLGDFEGE